MVELPCVLLTVRCNRRSSTHVLRLTVPAICASASKWRRGKGAVYVFVDDVAAVYAELVSMASQSLASPSNRGSVDSCPGCIPFVHVSPSKWEGYAKPDKRSGHEDEHQQSASPLPEV